jgi:hypothetical protein
MQQWEYLVETHKERDPKMLQQLLNERGAEGWELAAGGMMLGGWHSGSTQYCFKQPKSAKAD